ncbi:LacI family DNA-binding transcriptional regulator [Saccharibacillus sp. CPCC 101409]|uniref:LacI family DNA-binding transcriptional regulator n=1 Tax=Saccharibacillus sp. CPCC 101409 TaxID=3058041 RepID=UPI00267101B9|nr:LacI family DNA-binding transcriptional regulator [Saccharibacillus sp. CPCC 101409]MDO3411721.1 LacI family DNA-binding transcriptional regulator [Saccharibacillus sp. CPCC 101409]
MITIYDIARVTGYSPTTVSKVFNNYSDVSAKTRGKILDTAKEMGYMPNSHARTLMTKKSWTIGILFNESSGVGIRHPFFGGVLDSVKKTAEAEGYDLMFISDNIGGKTASYLEHCRFRSVDGVIVMLADRGDEGLQNLLKSDIPCVLLDFDDERPGCVSSDSIDGCYLALKHLHDLGHRRIAHISGGGDTFVGQQRRLGYEQGLRRLGLAADERLIVPGGPFFSVEGGRQAMLELLDLPQPPTAVLAAGDNLALGAIRALEERNLEAPRDMSIVGFDDIEAASLVRPALTTIRQDVGHMGARAARMLIGAIESEDMPPAAVLPVELIVRESCRRL